MADTADGLVEVVSFNQDGETIPDYDPKVDNEQFYDVKIAPLMAEVIALCQERNIPMVTSFQYKGEMHASCFWLPHGASQLLMQMAAASFPENFVVVQNKAVS